MTVFPTAPKRRISPKPYLCLILLLLLSTILSSGCARIYQDRGWMVEEICMVQEEQILQVESDPPASLWLNGEYVGETPLEIRLPYEIQKIDLSRKAFKKTPGKAEAEIISAENRQEDLPQPSLHTLHFKAPGHHDRFTTLNIPHPETVFHVELKDRNSGYGVPVKAIITIRTDRDRFPVVEDILAMHQAPGEIQKDPQKPVQTGGPPGGSDDFQQTFTVPVADLRALDGLMADLVSAAGRRNFRFQLQGIHFAAKLFTNPVREFRAVWVSYIDWPGTETDPARQKAIWIEMLDAFSDLNINVLFFHVRVEADALYRSRYEPWSRLLTGIPGRDPGYDPLAFAVAEAHKRGIELHAWMNPYRTRLSARCGNSRTSTAADHITRTHPEWVIDFPIGGRGCYQMLDPGIPEVTQWIARIAADIVGRYDVDGIHFDDMFYPYPGPGYSGAKGEDYRTYQKYGKGKIGIQDWRRENINGMIGAVNRSIKAVRKDVRFGISPFGIWRSGVPEGIRGMSSVDAIYSDALAWLSKGSIDYLTPQLYWKTHGSPDYQRLLEWWAEKVHEAGRHIYPGQIIYYVGTDRFPEQGNKPRSPKEIIEQVKSNREARDRSVLGNAFYRALNGEDQLLGPVKLRQELEKGLYAAPALPPIMDWLPVERPRSPINLQFEREGENPKDHSADGLNKEPPGTSKIIRLVWDDPTGPENGNRCWKYALYTVSREDYLEREGEIRNLGTLVAVTGEKSVRLRIKGQKEVENGAISLERGDLLFVTAVSGNNVESLPSVPLVFGISP